MVFGVQGINRKKLSIQFAGPTRTAWAPWGHEGINPKAAMMKVYIHIYIERERACSIN